MKHFERNGKFNWVDENNVVLGYDSHQACCERADYFYSDKPESIIVKGLNPDLSSYSFETSFFEEGGDGETGMAIFKLVSSNMNLPTLYLHLHNTHNGYYSHGFCLDVGGTVFRKGSL